MEKKKKFCEEEHMCAQEKRSGRYYLPEGFREIGPVIANGI